MSKQVLTSPTPQILVATGLVYSSGLVLSCLGARPSRIKTRQKTYNYLRRNNVVEPLLSGIVLGLIAVTLVGLFFAAYMQYKRGDQLGINK